MVALSALWLPILLSAVIVFIASSIIHMVLQTHKKEYNKLPGEDKVLAAMRAEGVTRGEYLFPCAQSAKDYSTPEMQEKYRQGPCGFVTIVPSRPPNMTKPLITWFLYSLVISFFAAYIASATLIPQTEYLRVFRITGAVAFIAYAAGSIPNSIWKGTPWSSTFRHIIDALIYGLLTAGVFGWLWPQVD